VQHEVVVVLVALRAVADEVDVLAHASSVAHVLQHDDAVLHDGMVALVADLGSEIDRREVRQHQQLTRLESGPHLLVVLTLQFFVCWWS
jgi:hypothetical protein